MKQVVGDADDLAALCARNGPPAFRRPSCNARIWSAFFSLSNIRKDSRLESFDFALVAFIKCPLFDALSADQPGLGQYLEVLTDCWLTHPKFLSDQYAAHSILDQIAIDLRRKMFGR